MTTHTVYHGLSTTSLWPLVEKTNKQQQTNKKSTSGESFEVNLSINSLSHANLITNY